MSCHDLIYVSRAYEALSTVSACDALPRSEECVANIRYIGQNQRFYLRHTYRKEVENAIECNSTNARGVNGVSIKESRGILNSILLFILGVSKIH